ncbi:MAG: hypothetical protein A2Z96_02525 [Spirochaetes bacterium GWB1_48_6]|nr:MAG: hypothetical protein A2Z96_02525 [Spirochaetes bacterium GWB1_48_6]
MELLAPAGNVEKLKFVLQYGADAAYMGFSSFSLRSQAGGMEELDPGELKKILGPKKLYAALNSYFLPDDLKRLDDELPKLQDYPISAFILSDMGLLPLLKKHFPHTERHLSTQANCLNQGSARVYGDLGFSRIILGREVPLDQIRIIRDAVPDLELEVFVHGAMCWAYSGRCYLSRGMAGAGRSGNTGDCTQSCRWDYKLYLEEAQRPGEFYEVDEEDGHTSLLSSRDLKMIDHLRDLQDAGVDSVKIEGRQKSAYYGSLVTRAYRAALDELDGKVYPWTEEHKMALEEAPHRDFSSGFFFDKEMMETPNEKDLHLSHAFLGYIGDYAGEGEWELMVRGPFRAGQTLEILSPDGPTKQDTTWVIRERTLGIQTEVNPGAVRRTYTIKSAQPLSKGMILRTLKAGSI